MGGICGVPVSYLPKIKKVQGCHCFQNCKLVDQQSEDHYYPVNASVDFEHVAFISYLMESKQFSVQIRVC